MAGGVEVGAEENLKSLEKAAAGYPIEIIKSPAFGRLKDLYGKAKFFWSAAGFGEDEVKNPQKVEHFGITTVEAMAGGAVPLVFAAGGAKEIVENEKDGLTWQNVGELLKFTRGLIKDGKKLRSLAKSARKKAEEFSYAKFNQRTSTVI